MTTYIERLIDRKNFQSNVIPRKISKFEQNNYRSNTYLTESHFQESNIELETKSIVEAQKQRPRSITKSITYNKTPKDFEKQNQNEENRTKQDEIIPVIVENSGHFQIKTSAALPTSKIEKVENRTEHIVNRNLNKEIKSDPVFSNIQNKKEFSKSEKNVTIEHNMVSITIGKLEIKAVKQEKSIAKKSMPKPSLTLEQYIKNKSSK